jgi:hypothetical protein
MPYRSKRQQRKFHAMADRGEIADSTVQEWDRATAAQPGGAKRLPESVHALHHHTTAGKTSDRR